MAAVIRPGTRLVALAGTVVALLGVATVPAGAHGDTGQMTVEVEPGSDADRVQVRARIVYANDFEPAPGAAVSADAVAPDGSVGVTAPLAYDADGVYAGELALPPGGPWTVRVTATNPVATGEAAYTSPPPTTTPATAPATASGSRRRHLAHGRASRRPDPTATTRRSVCSSRWRRPSWC